MAMTRRSRKYSSWAAASLASPEQMECACTRSVTKGEVMTDDRRTYRIEQLGRPRNNGAQYNEEVARSEEHTSELQSLMRISYAVFCLKKKKKNTAHDRHQYTNTT